MEVASECVQEWKGENKAGLKKRGEMERNTIKGTNGEILERK